VSVSPQSHQPQPSPSVSPAVNIANVFDVPAAGRASISAPAGQAGLQVQAVGQAQDGKVALQLTFVETINAKEESGRVSEFVTAGEIVLTATPAPETDILFRFRLPNVAATTTEWQLNPKCIRETQQIPGQYVVKVPKGVAQLALVRYKVDPKTTNNKPPLLLLPSWQITPQSAKLVARYKVNHRYISPQTEVSFLATVDPEGSVLSCAAHEPANTMRYSAAKQKCLWTLPLPQMDGAVSVSLQTRATIQPQPVLVNFAVENSAHLMSGLEVDAETDSALNAAAHCYLQRVVKRIKAGTFSAM
jgi:hypothetical protein